MFAFLKLPSIWGLFLDADSQKQKLELSEDLQQACEWAYVHTDWKQVCMEVQRLVTDNSFPVTGAWLHWTCLVVSHNYTPPGQQLQYLIKIQSL